MTLQFGLLGAGRIGKVHATAIGASFGANLKAVADAVPAAAQALAEAYGSEVRTLDAIIEARDIDAVVIATPTTLHADLVARAARAGKAIFCEKPIALSIDRVRQCLEVVRETGARLMVGFNRRFDPNFVEVKRQVDAGAVGTVEMVSIISRDPAPPPAGFIETSGGMFRDMTIHDFDMARFLLGEEPISVFASAANLVDPSIGALGDVDTAAIVLTTASGRICQISNSRRATYGYDQRIEVFGSKGQVTAENMRATTVEVATQAGYVREPLLDYFMTRYTDAYRNEITAFVQAVSEGRPMSPSGEDGLRAQLLAEAALTSASEGRVVRL